MKEQIKILTDFYTAIGYINGSLIYDEKQDRFIAKSATIDPYEERLYNEKYELFKKGYRLGRQSNEWVSVEDVLPPINEKIDVWDSYHNIRIADYGPFVSSWEDDFRKEVMLIRGHTHWRPRPEPPKED